jgi:hypothetical protein
VRSAPPIPSPVPVPPARIARNRGEKGFKVFPGAQVTRAPAGKVSSSCRVRTDVSYHHR